MLSVHAQGFSYKQFKDYTLFKPDRTETIFEEDFVSKIASELISKGKVTIDCGLSGADSIEKVLRFYSDYFKTLLFGQDHINFRFSDLYNQNTWDGILRRSHGFLDIMKLAQPRKWFSGGYFEDQKVNGYIDCYKPVPHLVVYKNTNGYLNINNLVDWGNSVEVKLSESSSHGLIVYEDEHDNVYILMNGNNNILAYEEFQVELARNFVEHDKNVFIDWDLYPGRYDLQRKIIRNPMYSELVCKSGNSSAGLYSMPNGEVHCFMVFEKNN